MLIVNGLFDLKLTIVSHGNKASPKTSSLEKLQQIKRQNSISTHFEMNFIESKRTLKYTHTKIEVIRKVSR